MSVNVVKVTNKNNQFLGNWKPNILKMLSSRGNHKLDEYFEYILGKERNLLKYAALDNKGKIYGFALVKNDPANKERKIFLISAKPGFGNRIMNKIKSNATSNNVNLLSLNALNQRALLNFYKRHGYANQGKNRNNLHYMTRRVPRRAASYY